MSQIILIEPRRHFFSILLVIMGFSYACSGVSGLELTWADSVVATVNVGIRPMALEFNPSNNNIYVANQGSNSISVIDSLTNTVNTTVNVGNSPRALEFNPSNNNMYVINFGLIDISVIDSSTNSVVETVGVGFGSIDLEFNPSNNNIYVANQGSNSISVIKTVDLESIGKE